MEAAPLPAPPGRAVLVWGVALSAYIAAIFHRTSLGVTGVEATQRFDISAATLATLTVAQLAVYAVMQVPVGMLLDRYGSRRLLLAGGVLMVAGQLAFALVTDVRLAVAARVLVGLGDAMSFISVLRLVAFWFPGRRNPLLVQLTGTLGQLGAVLAAVPLVALLQHTGWTTAFLTAAGGGAAVLLVVVAAVRDTPHRPAVPAPAPGGGRLAAAWAHPGTRLGLWTHFVTQFSGTVFALLWGFPFLVQGQGLSPTAAASLLTVLTLGMLLTGPLIAHLCARHPQHRSALVFTIVGATAAMWTVLLAWPGRAPAWLLVTLVLILALSGPGSMIGLDYARTFNPVSRLGSAAGIVNVGGFVASITLVLTIGVVLDLATPAGQDTPDLTAYRWAFSVQYGLWAVGVVQVLRWRNAARRDQGGHRPTATRAEVAPTRRPGGRFANGCDRTRRRPGDVAAQRRRRFASVRTRRRA
ncbi:MFS transporter [Micromonospora craniellae]|uniref:MFS transporter n=1 Tax=Micromonospora craniellae TaxID=2294034 RepID=A0A372FRA8_9ACTN|nr:MFS transporter [Micromonospora craniellae]RFS43228.1 MFS transporter [Micromonospora craniellae]